MIYGLLLTLFIIIGPLIILLVLVQQSKSSLGLGAMGGQAQMLFGGSGGQNIFQKVTWVLGITFMILSFALALMKSSLLNTRYLNQTTNQTVVTDLPTQKEIATPAPDLTPKPEDLVPQEAA